MSDGTSFRAGPLAEAELQALARQMAGRLAPPLVLYLQGELGAGKTTFTRALIQALGHEGSVKSPTYGLLEHYELSFGQVVHLDLYRLAEPGELEYLGIADLMDASSVLVVEWPERGLGFLPPPDLVIRFFHSGNQREVAFLPKSRSGKSVCASLSPPLKQVSS